MDSRPGMDQSNIIWFEELDIKPDTKPAIANDETRRQPHQNFTTATSINTCSTSEASHKNVPGAPVWLEKILMDLSEAPKLEKLQSILGSKISYREADAGARALVLSHKGNVPIYDLRKTENKPCPVQQFEKYTIQPGGWILREMNYATAVNNLPSPRTFGNFVSEIKTAQVLNVSDYGAVDKLWETPPSDPVPYLSDYNYSYHPKSIFRLDSFRSPLEVFKKEINVPGIYVPGILAGPYGSMSSTRSEDLEFGSMTYMYLAEPGGFAIWYFIHWDDRWKFIKKVWEVAGNKDQPVCGAILRLKSIIVPPRTLRSWGIRYFMVRQKPGDLIVTFPGVIYSVLNCSFNIKTANNFIPTDPQLLESIIKRKRCKCRYEDYTDLRIPIYQDGSIAKPHEKDMSRKFTNLMFRIYEYLYDQKTPSETEDTMKHKKPRIQCELCEKSFARKHDVLRHKKAVHMSLTKTNSN